MIVGFSKHGKGASRGPITYLTATHSPDGTRRHPPPVVLRGDPALVGQLIDGLPFAHKYVSGVLSFAPGEVITPEMEHRIMEAFERVAFAGLEPDQYSILWVRHMHADHHELNFLAPRVELSTGKSLNIAPPGKTSRELFTTLRDWVNTTYGLAAPDDPARARDVSLPNHLARLQADATRKGQALKEDLRQAITARVRREVNAGRIQDRAGVEMFLQAQGFHLARVGAEYLSVVIDPKAPTNLGHIRLRGGLYSTTAFAPYERATTLQYDRPDPVRAAHLAETLAQQAAARARYHQQRYGRPEASRVRQAGLPAPEYASARGETLKDYLTRTLGEVAIIPKEDDSTAARSTQRRRQRQRRAAAIATMERDAHDRPGDAPPRRLEAIGSGSLYTRGRLDAATRRLDNATHGVATGITAVRHRRAVFTASLEDWYRWWQRYLGLDERAPER